MRFSVDSRFLIFDSKQQQLKMTGQIVEEPNPSALSSHLPDSINDLLVEVDKKTLSDDVNHSLVAFQRAANYIAAGVYK